MQVRVTTLAPYYLIRSNINRKEMSPYPMCLPLAYHNMIGKALGNLWDDGENVQHSIYSKTTDKV